MSRALTGWATPNHIALTSSSRTHATNWATPQQQLQPLLLLFLLAPPSRVYQQEDAATWCRHVTNKRTRTCDDSAAVFLPLIVRRQRATAKGRLLSLHLKTLSFIRWCLHSRSDNPAGYCCICVHTMALHVFFPSAVG